MFRRSGSARENGVEPQFVGDPVEPLIAAGRRLATTTTKASVSDSETRSVRARPRATAGPVRENSSNPVVLMRASPAITVPALVTSGSMLRLSVVAMALAGLPPFQCSANRMCPLGG